MEYTEADDMLGGLTEEQLKESGKKGGQNPFLKWKRIVNTEYIANCSRDELIWMHGMIEREFKKRYQIELGSCAN